MKLAVPVTEKLLDASIDQRFGRAPFFLIYDTANLEHHFVDNTQNLESSQGAGIQSAQHIVNAGAQALLTPHCGPKAFKVLQTAKVDVYTCNLETAKQAIGAYRDGLLSKTDQADVEGHWI